MEKDLDNVEIDTKLFDLMRVISGVNYSPVLQYVLQEKNIWYALSGESAVKIEDYTCFMAGTEDERILNHQNFYSFSLLSSQAIKERKIKGSISDDITPEIRIEYPKSLFEKPVLLFNDNFDKIKYNCRLTRAIMHYFARLKFSDISFDYLSRRKIFELLDNYSGWTLQITQRNKTDKVTTTLRAVHIDGYRKITLLLTPSILDHESVEEETEVKNEDS